MNKQDCFYVASCVFTRGNPELSEKIQSYIRDKYGFPIIRCCTPQYKVLEFENSMPEWYVDKWKRVPHYSEFKDGDTMISICHNCSAIFEEQKPLIKRISVWELILQDESFPFPDYNQEKMTIQDCWRSKENYVEQEVVRQLMHKMNIDIVELENSHDKTEFCGISLYQAQPPRNPNLAPHRFIEKAKGKFISHTDEEKQKLMRLYCNQFTTNKVIAYCHYCVTGLNVGGVDGLHLAQLLFESEKYLLRDKN
jgi:hypothetical protein